MFVPLSDDYQKRDVPWVTIGLIVLNTVIYFALGYRPDYKDIEHTWGYIPANGVSVTLLTSMFLHAGVLHLLGNMLFLWIAGSVEDAMGRPAYIGVYLLGGCGAALAHGLVVTGEARGLPLVGASGAIAAVLGAYIVILPHARLKIWYLFYLRPGTFRVASVWAIGFWFLLQVVNSTSGGHFSGIAYFAHVGGFITGALLALALAQTGLVQKHWDSPAGEGLGWDAGDEPALRGLAATPEERRASMTSLAQLGDVIHTYPLDTSILTVYWIGGGILLLVTLGLLGGGIVGVVAVGTPGIMTTSTLIMSCFLLGAGTVSGKICFNTLRHAMARQNSVVAICRDGLQWIRGTQVQAFRWNDVRSFTDTGTVVRFVVHREPVEIPREYVGFDELVATARASVPFNAV